MKVFERDIDFTMTPIIAYSLIVLLFVFGFLGLERYAGLVEQNGERVKNVQSEYIIMQEIKDQPVWEARLAESMKLIQKTEAYVWSGNTNGIIAAELTQTLRKIGTDLSTYDVNIRVDSESTEIDGVMVLSFEYVLRLPRGKGVIDILAELAMEPRSIIITESNFAHSLRDRRLTRLSISGIIPIKLLKQ